MRSPLRFKLLTVALASGLLVGAGVAQAQGPADPTASDPGAALAAPDSQGTDPTGEEPAEEVEPAGPEPAKLKIRLRGDGKVPVGTRARVIGTLKPFARGEKVRVLLRLRGKTVGSRTLKLARKGKRDAGQFKTSWRVVEPGRYRVVAKHAESEALGKARGATGRFEITYPAIRQGARGGHVRVLNHLLDKLGYVTGKGSRFGGRTARAVLAYRKVNRMARTTRLTSSIFRRLAAGKGGFKLRDPGKGKQIEVDISRQVMALAVNGKVIRTYHVSTGAPATPTVRGKWTFYRRHPGYNAIGMYWSSFWVRGYAIHGYKSVPTYPASHGCVRVALSEAKWIYDWIDDGPSGTTIYTYS